MRGFLYSVSNPRTGGVRQTFGCRLARSNTAWYLHEPTLTSQEPPAMRRWSRLWRWVKKAVPHRARTYRPFTEGLEARRLLAAPVIDPIAAQTVPAGKTLFVPVTGGDADGNPLTYTVTSSNPQVTAQVRPRSPFLRISV